MSFWEYANPVKFLELSKKVRRVSDPLAVILIVATFVLGFVVVPDDVKHGSSIKIMFIHVPAAMLSINAWAMMVVTSLVWLIRRHHVSALAAKSGALVGLFMTLIAIFTGMLWGVGSWGTAWVWDPRLKSYFILLLFYLAYLALWSAIEDHRLAADMTSILALVGAVFAMLSRYAVFFQGQGLHQAATLSLDRETHISDVYYYPLLLGFAGFFFFFVSMVLILSEGEILKRRLLALRHARAHMVEEHA